jgi:hypothetical protein
MQSHPDTGRLRYPHIGTCFASSREGQRLALPLPLGSDDSKEPGQPNPGEVEVPVPATVPLLPSADANQKNAEKISWQFWANQTRRRLRPVFFPWLISNG